MSDHTRLIALLRSAIESCLDDPARTGIVLSGGLDSSTVTALSDQLGYALPTFTGYYDEAGFDERRWSRLVGRGHHYEVRITAQDFVENFDAMAAAVAPPYQGMGTFGQFMVGKWIAENTDVRVLLSGEGSDELFGGYPRLMAVAGVPLPDNYGGYKTPAGYPQTLEEALAYDLAALADLLAVDDQCMNAHGLTALAPFTDDEVVKFALALPATQRVGKTFLRRAVRGIVPNPIIDRTDNMGFPIPLVAWAQEEPVRSFVLDRLGYLPSPGHPWERTWFHELIRDSVENRVAA